MNIPNASASEGNIPQIEDGLYVGKFLDVEPRQVDSFITEKDQFGKPDDGVRWDFPTSILDEDRNPVVPEDAEDPDDILIIKRTAKSVKNAKAGITGFSADDRSNGYMYLKGILTPTELALWEASGKGDAQADALWAAAAATVNGREVNVQISHNDKGYPQIEAFVGPAKPKKASK